MGDNIRVNTLDYWKNNAEEDYMRVPISVLRYISILEELNETKVIKLDLADVRERFQEFIEKQEDIPPKIQKVIKDKFWELL